MNRTACSPTPEGCGRCHSTRRPSPDTETLLLLMAHNGHAHEAIARVLERCGVTYRTAGQVLMLPTDRRRMSLLRETLDSQVPKPVQNAVRAVFFQGDPACPASALTAFVGAEPLPTLLSMQADEWVRDALDDGWLFSVFHPIVEAGSLRPFAYEALIRARHPETREVIGAGPIIGACERLDLQHVLDQLARQTAIRNAAALALPYGRFFVNFLPNTIYDPEICLRTTMEAADECGIDVSRLVFQVVETESIPDMKRLRHILDYYRSRGVGTAVDDMGAGYSSTDYLTALRPDYVKLDRALVVKAEDDWAARWKMAEIIRVARDLGIQVIAEGIETVTQRQVCLDLGVDYLQGFLFAHPANPPQAVRAEMISGSLREAA
jgi:EAL domain-containing protein (putative c-di-GMP-specific phosphodiesterase class I)